MARHGRTRASEPAQQRAPENLEVLQGPLVETPQAPALERRAGVRYLAEGESHALVYTPRAEIPCRRCGAIFENGTGRAVLCRAIDGRIVRLRCRVCGNLFNLPDGRKGV